MFLFVSFVTTFNTILVITRYRSNLCNINSLKIDRNKKVCHYNTVKNVNLCITWIVKSSISYFQWLFKSFKKTIVFVCVCMFVHLVCICVCVCTYGCVCVYVCVHWWQYTLKKINKKKNWDSKTSLKVLNLFWFNIVKKKKRTTKRKKKE